MDNNITTDKNLFNNTDISDLCDSIKHVNEILKTVGEFFNDLDMNNDYNGNGLLIEFKRWGVKTITRDLIHKQIKNLNRIKEIYEKALESL